MSNNELNNRLQAHVIHSVLENSICENECSLHTISDDNGVEYKQAVVKVEDDEDINVVFTLPQSNSKNVYITATEGNPTIIRNIFANIEESEKDKNIKLGNVLLLTSADLSRKDICGVIFIPIDVSSVLDYLPQNITFEGRELQFLLVTFISNTEHDTWLLKGHDALMEYFADTNKDLIQF